MWTTRISAACVLAGLALGAPPSWAGGEQAELDDDHSADAGPPYFGFVRDARGFPIKDAKVSLSFRKSNITFTMQSNVLGMYKMRNPDKDAKPGDVVVSCAKEGYRQTRTFLRTSNVGGKPAIETGCQMQKE
jgi:hypothetical protein